MSWGHAPGHPPNPLQRGVSPICIPDGAAQPHEWLLSFRFRGRIALYLNHGYCHSRELLIDGIAALRRGLRFLKEVLEASRIRALDHAKARFVAHVVGNLRFGRA